MCCPQLANAKEWPPGSERILSNPDCISVDSDHWKDSGDYDFDDNDRRSYIRYSESVLSEYLTCTCGGRQLPDFDAATVCAEEGGTCACDGMVRFGSGTDEGGTLGGED